MNNELKQHCNLRIPLPNNAKPGETLVATPHMVMLARLMGFSVVDHVGEPISDTELEKYRSGEKP